MTNKPPHRDPAHPEFWESRYREQVTPWDRGSAPADFLRWVHSLPRGSEVLVPGCGSGYEVEVLWREQHRVKAIDYSAEAVTRARARLGSAGPCIEMADFFAPETSGRFQAVYECAFLCALPPQLWPSYGRRMAELIVPGGQLAGYFFIAEETGRGPPFTIDQTHLDRLLSPWFQCETDRVSADSLPVFAGKERWQVWRRAA